MFDTTSFIEESSQKMKDEIDDIAIIACSGGVDSTVAAVIASQAVGDKLHCVYVDTGLMRKDETKEIQEMLAAHGLNLTTVFAEDRYFDALADVTEPEQKRKIIGELFIRIFEEEQDKVGAKYLVQGTIAPDWIESGGGVRDTIKSHHNVGGLPDDMTLEVVEPLRDLYKDEVRELGVELGLPHDLVWRHPFPGPGLGVRILCAQSASTIEEDLDIAITHAGLPVQSVGVQGDGRSYRHAVSLFTHEQYPNEQCWNLATSIPNQSSAFNRVLMCTSHAEVPEFVFTPGYVTMKRSDLLREADALVHRIMYDAGFYADIWQFPVVLLPFGTSEGGQSIVLRPVESQEAMTANAAVIPELALKQMTKELLSLDGIDMVFQDLTHKPPGTIEWE